MIQADPAQLRYSATRFAAGAQEFLARGTRLQRIAAEILQGNQKWSGQGAFAFAHVIDHLHHDLMTASQAFDSASSILQSLAYQMEQVNHLREEARQIESAIWSSVAMSPEEQQRLYEMRRRAQELAYQADVQASAADGQAAAAFHDIAAMEQKLYSRPAPATSTPTKEKSSFWHGYLQSMEKEFGVYYHFEKGIAESVWEAVEGIWNLVTDPNSLDNIGAALANPGETAEAVGTAIKDSFEQDVIHGDADSRAEWFGHAIGEVVTAVVGTKGLDKVGDLIKVSALASKTAAATETAATVAEDVAEVAGENGNVDTLYAEAMDTRHASGYLTAGRISSESLSFDQEVETILGRYGMSKEEFNLLKNKQLDAPGTLTPEERQLLMDVRSQVNLTSDTVMQKVIHLNDVDKYLNGQYGEIGGYVARAQDVVDLKDPLEIKNELSLHYNSPIHKHGVEYYNPERPNPYLDKDGNFKNEPVAMIRFEAVDETEYAIPFEFDNELLLKKNHPFNGSGFLAGEKIIPEFTLPKRMEIPMNTEIFIKNLDGTETLIGRYHDNGFWETFK